MSDGSAKPVIFISYSHKDPDELEYVRSHLGPLAGLGVLLIWDDNELQIGDDWRGDINSAIDTCEVFILLVSRHSLSSRFIREVEVPRILPRWQKKQVRFCPIVVTPCHMDGYWWLDAPNRRPKGGKALSELDEPVSDREMTAIVGEIAKIVSPPAGYANVDGTALEVPQPMSSKPSIPDIVDYGHLPETPYKTLVGREAELTALDEAWIDKLTNIVSLVAWGGAGKSALLNEWLLQMRGDNYRGAQAVLGWSFYSQGTKERATSAEGFLDWAMQKLNVAATSNSAVDKAEKLAEAMARRRVLLVLDGMEPLQHGPDGQEGYLKDQGMRTFLRRFAAMPSTNSDGLIVITSRLEIRDIERLKGTEQHPGPHQNMLLHRLSDEASAALLKDNGVMGSEIERRAAAHEFDGHALALSLLASYLAELHGGDVRRRDHVRALLSDSKNPGHGHAWRVMESYEKEWLHLNPMLRTAARILGPKYLPASVDKMIIRSILSIVGLFDRPASVDCLAALRCRPAIRGLTDVIVGLDDDEWKHAVARLRKARLLDPEDPNAPGVLDAHPLVREWFGDRLKQTNEGAWKAAHGRLYEHLRDTTKEGDEPTLEGLGPLYQAIAHGCRAGRYQEAWDNIYIDRICRRKTTGEIVYYATRRLGALGSDLAAISWFFDKPFERKAAAILKESDRAWLLSQASQRLRASGRLAEALPPMQAALEMAEEAKDWPNAAIGARNLSETELLVGAVIASVMTAERSAAIAGRSGDKFEMMLNQTMRACALHAAGRREEAEHLFADAELRQRERQPRYPLLYSVHGYFYCDLLLNKGDHAAVRDRAIQTREWARSQNWLLDIALGTLAIGRADLKGALANVGPHKRSVAGSCDEARAHLDEAVHGLRASAQSDHIPRGLLARAAFRRSVGDWDGAARDLDEVAEIAEPGPMKLHLCDMELERARMTFARNEEFAPLNGPIEDSLSRPVADTVEEPLPKDQARASLAKARKFIAECGYHRRDEELAELEAVLREERKFVDLPPRA